MNSNKDLCCPNTLYIIEQNSTATAKNSVSFGNFIIDQPNITLNYENPNATVGAILEGELIGNWQVNGEQIETAADNFSILNGTTFVVSKAGVYYIDAALSLFPGGENLSGQPYFQLFNPSIQYYGGNILLSFKNADGTFYPFAGSTSFIGFTKRAEDSIALTLRYIVYLPNDNMQFNFLNDSNSAIKLINGGGSGTAGQLTIYRIGTSIEN